MEYFTQRNGLRKPIETTPVISSDMYAIIFDCCERYYNNIAWKYPAECPDGHGCCGLDLRKLSRDLKFEIPTLHRNGSDLIDKDVRDGYVDKSLVGLFGDADDDDDGYIPSNFDQYALLDFIEFIYKHIKDFKINGYHSFFNHNHLEFLGTRQEKETFKNEINSTFDKVGLLYQLTRCGNIERIGENVTLISEIESQIPRLSEKGLQELLDIAISLYKSPKPVDNKLAVEKIWDALENLKLYFKDSQKKQENQKIADILSGYNNELFRIFDTELSELGNIGNNYHIRHYNEQQKQVVDDKHYDYFFNRCLSLIALAIKYLK